MRWAVGAHGPKASHKVVTIGEIQRLQKREHSAVVLAELLARSKVP